MFLFGDSAKDSFGFKIGSFLTKVLCEVYFELIVDIDILMELVAGACQDWMVLVVLDWIFVLYVFGCVFVPVYEACKLVMGTLDFDDLISKVRVLLTDLAVAQWVLFWLDGGIDYVLVDEV